MWHRLVNDNSKISLDVNNKINSTIWTLPTFNGLTGITFATHWDIISTTGTSYAGGIPYNGKLVDFSTWKIYESIADNDELYNYPYTSTGWTYNITKSNGYAVFNGTNSRAWFYETPVGSIYEIQAYSISLIFNINQQATGATDQILYECGSMTHYGWLQLYIEGNTNKLKCKRNWYGGVISNTGFTYTETIKIIPHEWVNIIYTIDAYGMHSVYLDGVKRTGTNNNIELKAFICNGIAWLGCSSSLDKVFNGWMYDFFTQQWLARPPWVGNPSSPDCWQQNEINTYLTNGYA